MTRVASLCVTLVAIACLAAQTPPPQKPELIESKAIWSRAPHNAFSDLIRFKDRWYCVFREGTAASSPDGTIRVLTSLDGEVWMPAATLSYPSSDLRDPKLSVIADGRLMLNAFAVRREAGGTSHHSLVWFSTYGRDFTDPLPACDPGVRLSRVTWRRDRAFGLASPEAKAGPPGLYTSTLGIGFEPIASGPFPGDGLIDASLLFLPDHTAISLLQGDHGGTPRMHFGKSIPPYRAWTWQDLGVPATSPNIIQLPDDRVVAAIGLQGDKPRTLLCWLFPENGRLLEFLSLPSGGDTGHPGLVFYDGSLWVSYHSSHEGKAMIYLARVKLPQIGASPGRGETRSENRYSPSPAARPR